MLIPAIIIYEKIPQARSYRKHMFWKYFSLWKFMFRFCALKTAKQRRSLCSTSSVSFSVNIHWNLSALTSCLFRFRSLELFRLTYHSVDVPHFGVPHAKRTVHSFSRSSQFALRLLYILQRFHIQIISYGSFAYSTRFLYFTGILRKNIRNLCIWFFYAKSVQIHFSLPSPLPCSITTKHILFEPFIAEQSSMHELPNIRYITTLLLDRRT